MFWVFMRLHFFGCMAEFEKLLCALITDFTNLQHKYLHLKSRKIIIIKLFGSLEFNIHKDVKMDSLKEPQAKTSQTCKIKNRAQRCSSRRGLVLLAVSAQLKYIFE